MPGSKELINDNECISNARFMIEWVYQLQREKASSLVKNARSSTLGDVIRWPFSLPNTIRPKRGELQECNQEWRGRTRTATNISHKDVGCYQCNRLTDHVTLARGTRLSLLCLFYANC
ncbi:hypothetical protein Zmor_002582 [Zophobas morio]|uniref:Uncharacterized protein n=1 Tax=Zophobas morio TaxID=2755281 RepID=A0AA38JB39_9CUCU|nr:hypothetical protein Zmor_002582 [Zophobas morio]